MSEEEKEDRPLWLPKGSIRAIITLMTIGSVCYAFISEASFAMPEWMIAVVMAIITHYFDTRALAK